MQKAKLGISVGLLAAVTYFMGLISTIPLILLAGYILLAEENEWLRKAAVKAVAIVVIAALVPSLLGLLDNVFGVINVVFGWVHLPVVLKYPFEIDTLIKTVVYFVRDGLLLLCGFMALSQGSVKAGGIDKIVDKHMR